jgi:hypothetical protein
LKNATNALPKPSQCEYFDYGDARLNKRCEYMLELLPQNAGKTLRQALQERKDYEVALRFFDNDLVSPEKILEPHLEATRARCAGEELVAVLQDSSDLDYDYLDVEGFGSMHPGVDQGFRIHPSLVITETGLPLGLVGYQAYTREDDVDVPKKHRNSLPIEEKESYRWLEGYRHASYLAQALGRDTTVVSISDREGDLYEVLKEAEGAQAGSAADIIIRAQHNRCLNEPAMEYRLLEEKLHRLDPLLQARLTVNRGRSNEREACVNIRACQVSILAPATANKKRTGSVTCNAVLVSEVDPILLQSEEPKDKRKRSGNAGLYWVLITTMPIDSVVEVERIVDLYSSRWQIEVYFKVLKSGCGIDRIRFQTKERIENYIAFSLLVAWRVMLATYLPREHPDVPCTVLFTETEWKLAYLKIYERAEALPLQPPTLMEATRMIAQLGGYHKRKTQPGITTVWRGLSKLYDIVYGYELAERHKRILERS